MHGPTTVNGPPRGCSRHPRTDLPVLLCESAVTRYRGASVSGIHI